MTVSYPLTLPTGKRMSVEWTPRSVVAVSASPFTLQQQVQAHAGQIWAARVKLVPMLRTDAEAWIATLLALNGRQGTFHFGDPSATAPRGNPQGTPLVDGVSQTGQVLLTKGWTPSAVTWTIRTSAADNGWVSVTWAPELGLFCAVATTGVGNRVMTSPDGITWTIRTSAADNEWRSVAWAPALGLFCAVATTGVGNRVMTSPGTLVLLRGDWFQIGAGSTRRIYRVLKDVGANDSGKASLDIWPRLRESPANNAPLVVTNTAGTFRLADNVMDWSVDRAMIYGLEFDVVEAI